MENVDDDKSEADISGVHVAALTYKCVGSNCYQF